MTTRDPEDGAPADPQDSPAESTDGQSTVPVETALAHVAAAIAAGRLADADRVLGAIREVWPDHPEALHMLGILAYRAGNGRAAAAWFMQTIEHAPDHATAWANLGLALRHLGHTEDAVKRLHHATELDPEFAQAWAALGDALAELDEAAEAETALERAVSLRPDRADWHHRLGDVRHAAGAFEGAVVAYRQALALDPGRVPAWFGLGCACLSRREYAAAAEALGRVLELVPGDVGAAQNRGRALFELGRVEDAVDHFRIAAAAEDPAIAALARESLAVILPSDSRADNATILAARRAWAESTFPAAPTPPRPAIHEQGRKLRIGYLSSFFDKVNWMKPVWGLFNAHDRDRVAIHLFSDAPRDRLATGYRPHPEDGFDDLTGLDAEAAAAVIARAGLDLLVDLNGYSRIDRLPLVARRPAPLTAGWFNYYATSGMSAVDVLIGDPTVIPPEEEPFYSERIRRVPHSYLAFSVEYPVPPLVPPPCLERGAITFGCLAPQYKITPEMVAILAEILARCPGSRLILRSTGLIEADNRAFVAGAFAEAGIAAERLELIGPAEHYAFLQTYDAIDIAIDTFPYNGGQTTTEAIWQGVPFLTIWGDRWVGRTSASILRAGGLGEWVAEDRAGLVERAVALATAPDAPARLAELRATLRERLAASPVCDTAALARAMEGIYRELVEEAG